MKRDALQQIREAIQAAPYDFRSKKFRPQKHYVEYLSRETVLRIIEESAGGIILTEKAQEALRKGPKQESEQKERASE